VSKETQYSVCVCSEGRVVKRGCCAARKGLGFRVYSLDLGFRVEGLGLKV
jgi:hypothetical protein